MKLLRVSNALILLMPLAGAARDASAAVCHRRADEGRGLDGLYGWVYGEVPPLHETPPSCFGHGT